MLIIAHRGARSLAPENTLKAAEIAFEVGAHMWETDIAVTSDGELIIFHNDSLTDFTDVEQKFPDRSPWLVNHFTLKEVRALDAGSWFTTKDPFKQIAEGNVTTEAQKSYKNTKIPTLIEALEFTRDNNWKVNLELKKQRDLPENFSLTDQLIKTLEDLKLSTKNFLISSFNHDWLREVISKKADYEIEALVGYPDSEPLAWDNFEFKTYNVNRERTTTEEIREVINKGIKVNLYNIREDMKDILSFVEVGVSGLITDFPQNLIGTCISGVINSRQK